MFFFKNLKKIKKMKILKSLDSVNGSRFFAGLVMIMMNIGSKYVNLKLSKTQEQFLKGAIARQILIFSIIWMGTRDIITSLILTAVFVILTDHLFNEDSKFCVFSNVIKKYKNILDTDGDNVVSEKELEEAMKIVAKHKEKLKKNQE
tara:strand:- start:27 stop:467 length:441 start_codon:yes stop_codon:yes gene_type:complete